MFRKGREILLISCLIVTIFFLSALPSQSTAAVGDCCPAIAYDVLNNRYLTVYAKNNGSYTDICGQFVDRDGALLGEELVFSYADSNQGDAYPSVAYDGANQRFLAVWADFRNAAISGSDIYGQLVDTSGALAGENFLICKADGNQEHPSVAYDSDSQRFFVVWADWRNSLSSSEIFGQFVTSDAKLAGENYVISAAAGSGRDSAGGNQQAGTKDSTKSATSDVSPAATTIVLSSVTPDPFGLGVTLTLSGSGFGEKKAVVKFGKTSAKILSWHDTSITCSLASGKAGAYAVKVVIKKVESNVVNVTLSGPVIDNISPSSGNPKTNVTINGHYFGTKKPTVQFISDANKKTTAKVAAYTDTQLTVAIPNLKLGAYQVTVKNGAGQSDGFQFNVGLTLTVGVNPSGGGSVTGTGIDCPGDCSELYNSGTNVTLTANPSTGGFTFANWTGCDSPSGNVCNMTMNNNKSVTANFTNISKTLNVSIDPSGGGTVTGTGINCPGDCSESYGVGTNVTLTANPSSGGFAFANWTGCDSPSGNVCNMTMNNNKSVTASFTSYKPFSQLGSAWTYSSGTITYVLTFLADLSNPTSKGSYMLSMKYNNNSGGGIQTGDYTYDPSNGAFSITGLRETNASLTGFKNQSSNAKIDGNSDTLRYADGGVAQFTRVASASNSLVGSWSTVDSETNNLTVLTFMDGTNYAYAFDVTQVDPNGGVSGVEFGTYSYSGSTLRKLSISVDTNGKAGFDELPASGINMPMSGNTITLPARDASSSPVVLNKVQ